MKKAIALIVMLTFVIGLAGLTLAAEEKGTVIKGIITNITKIECNKLTIKKADGTEVTVEVKEAKGLKVGDEVTVKDGVVEKATPVKKKKKVIEGC